jgi:putative transposase
VSETSGEKGEQARPAPRVPQELVDQLLERANAEGSDLLGPDGLLSAVTKQVLEGALDTELAVRAHAQPG